MSEWERNIAVIAGTLSWPHLETVKCTHTHTHRHTPCSRLFRPSLNSRHSWCHRLIASNVIRFLVSLSLYLREIYWNWQTSRVLIWLCSNTISFNSSSAALFYSKFVCYNWNKRSYRENVNTGLNICHNLSHYLLLEVGGCKSSLNNQKQLNIGQ